MHDTQTLNEQLERRGLGHVAGLLELAAARPWIRNEFPEGGGGGAETVEAAEPIDGVDDTGAETPDPAAAPAGLTREEMLSLAREGAGAAFSEMLANAEAEERARQAREQARTPQELPDWNPFDQGVVMQHLAASPLGQAIMQLQAQLGEVSGVTNGYLEQQGEQQANSLLDAMKTGDNGIGEFDNARAVQAARQMLAADPNLDPEDALRQAAQAERAYVDNIEAAALARFRQQGQNLAGQTAEPSGGGGAAGEVNQLPRGPEAYKVQLRRTLANSGQAPGVVGATG